MRRAALTFCRPQAVISHLSRAQTRLLTLLAREGSGRAGRKGCALPDCARTAPGMPRGSPPSVPRWDRAGAQGQFSRKAAAQPESGVNQTPAEKPKVRERCAPEVTQRESRLVRGWIRNARGESQNHRIVGVGRDLCGSSSPTLLPKQGHLQQAAQDLVQMGLEYLQRRRLHNLPGQPVPVLRHPQRSRDFFFLMKQVLLLKSCPGETPLLQTAAFTIATSAGPAAGSGGGGTRAGCCSPPPALPLPARAPLGMAPDLGHRRGRVGTGATGHRGAVLAPFKLPASQSQVGAGRSSKDLFSVLAVAPRFLIYR